MSNTNFQVCDADHEHQHLAGVASWRAFSARWRARQGLPLLHPIDVQYLTPQDFHTTHGQPLPPTEQRRLFRQYIEAAMRVSAHANMADRRRALPESGDIAYIRTAGVVRKAWFRQDFVYGREDIPPYEEEALCPARPYGIPVTSSVVEPYWLALNTDLEEDEKGDTSWMAE